MDCVVHVVKYHAEELFLVERKALFPRGGIDYGYCHLIDSQGGKEKPPGLNLGASTMGP